MGLSEDVVLAWFSQYAYQPLWVYSAIVTLMIASSFGFPIPEEVTLVSAGLVCYMGSRPDLFPPPEVGMAPVNVYFTATLCFLAVFLSDFLVYSLGKFYGSKLLRLNFFQRYAPSIEKVSVWTRKYGAWAAGFFRFTPGLRFPGHFACGMLGLSSIRFALVDGTAALISVPTQVLLVAAFGETILENFKHFKIIVFSTIVIFAAIYFIRKRFNHYRSMTY